MARLLDRLGRTTARHKWLTIGTWFVIAIALVVGAKASGGETVDVFTIPGAQSQKAADLLKQRFPSQSGDTANVVFAVGSGALTDPGNAAAIAQVQQNLAALPHVSDTPTAVVGPATPAVGSQFVSQSAKIGYARVQYDEAATSLPGDTFDRLSAAAAPARSSGIRVEFGGPVVDYIDKVDATNGDTIGLAVAVIILLLAFGSVVAMSLPIGTALFGLGVGLAIITLIAAVADIGTAAPTLATMIGLGVGIDYSLFILTRHRQNLAAGMEIEQSIGHAIATAGQAVLFAGTTVVIAISGLAVAGIPYVTKLGFMSAVVVAVMMTAAVTLLPALLGLVGRHVDSLRVPHLPRHRKEPSGDDGGFADRRRRSPSSRGRPEDDDAAVEGRGWKRWAHFMSRHRWAAVIVSLAILLTLAAPFLSMRLGMTDDGTAPEDTTQRQAFDLIATGFGPGANGPLVLAISLPQANDTAPADAVQTAVAKLRGLKVAPPQVSPDGDAAVIVMIPRSAPDSEATSKLVERLREHVLPDAVAGTGAAVYVGGVTAAFIDIGDRIQDRLPLFIGVVVGLSFLLLMVVFRSVLVPLKAAIMNLLSIGAAYGVIVAVFQWGWAKGLFGLDQTIPIVAFVPMMMFAILFGLSMDYEVFLLSRIREEYARTGDNLESVVQGLATTARVITSAALIMISVFLAFVPDPEPTIKMFGLGLAVAVFVDATIVRLVLVPATMELLGPANWWLPKWLDRILPKVEIE